MGAAITEYFSRSGSAPPAGSQVTSAKLALSSIRTYSTKGTYLSLGSYGSTNTLGMNESSHSAEVGASIGNAILGFGGGNLSITVRSSQGGSGSQINFRDGCRLTLTVYYAEPSTAAAGGFEEPSVAVGETITLYFTASSHTHMIRAVWSLGAHSATTETSGGYISTELTIPMAWLAAIPGKTATAKVILYTYTAGWGSLIGSNTYTFTVVIPAGLLPTIGNFTATHILTGPAAGWGTYIQDKSKVKLDIIGAQASTGAAITSYRIAGGGYAWSSASGTSFTTGFLTAAENVTFTATATDSRGLTASRTLQITVTPYAAPSFARVVAFRCMANGTASETGAYVSVTCSATHASFEGRNTLELLGYYRKVGDAGWSPASSLISGVTKILAAGMTGEALYELRVVARDLLSGTAERVVDVAAAQYTVFYGKGGRNVSIGKTGARTNALEINPDWSVFHGEVNLTERILSTRPIVYGMTAPAGAVEGTIWLKPV